MPRSGRDVVSGRCPERRSSGCRRSPTIRASSSRSSTCGSSGGTFERVRERNRGGPRWSFIDGPVTANKILAVHTAWGRTLKDVFQRYRAMRGFDQRYQNGFDCQGLWIEVGVERELGFNSKREIESYGLAEFARRCREKVVWSAEELTRGSKRLGQWMDWGNDYYTFSDTNIEYIWRFLKLVHERGWLYTAASRDRVVPALRDLDLPARAAAGRRLPRPHRPVALRPLPAASTGRASRWSSGRRRRGRCRRTSPRRSTPTPSTSCATAASGSPAPATDDGPVHASLAGRELVGLAYDGPFDHLPPAAGVEHRVIPWDEVSLEEGTGIVHIAPGCGARGLRAVAARTGSPSSRRSTRPAASSTTTAGSTGARPRVADQIVADLAERGRLVAAEEFVHRYPHCWRCQTPLIFRLSDDWFIAVDEVRAARCSRPTQRCAGRRTTWAGAWTTGCATWATGTSRASATSASPSPSTRARAGI